MIKKENYLKKTNPAAFKKKKEKEARKNRTSSIKSKGNLIRLLIWCLVTPLTSIVIAKTISDEAGIITIILGVFLGVIAKKAYINNKLKNE